MEMRYDVDDNREFWHFSDQLRLQTPAASNFSNLSLAGSIWSPPLNDGNTSLSLPYKASNVVANRDVNNPGLIGSGKLAFANATTTNADRYNYFPTAANAKSDTNKPNNTNTNTNTNSSSSYYYSDKQQIINGNGGAGDVKSYFNKSVGRPTNNNNNTIAGAGLYGHGKKSAGDVGVGGRKKNSSGGFGNGNGNSNGGNGMGSNNDKRFKSLPAAEALPKNECIGGYIFVCNNDTMEENLKRQLFGLPSRYRDSVRAIRPGLPLFLYNYSTHQLHGIFEAASFGGSNIDPTAWEDNKHSDSRFPAQVRVATRKICEPLEEDAFRPILHHYDGPKFRLELSVAEAISLLDIFAEKLFA